MSPAVADQLRTRLADRGLAWTAPIAYFEALGSTSDWLKERARDGEPEWSVCMAGRQTAGRGRQGKIWASPPGNLYLSVLLKPRFPARLLALIPLAAGVAVAQALEESGLAASLKWPNDLVVDGRKLAGVLAEASAAGAGGETVVLGVGVNVGADPSDLPEQIRGSATSMAAERGVPQDVLGIAAAVLARLTLCYDALARGEAADVLAEWRSRSVAWWGRIVEIWSGEDVVRGVARDVDESGALLLELADGSLRRLLSGEVRELRPASEALRRT